MKSKFIFSFAVILISIHSFAAYKDISVDPSTVSNVIYPDTTSGTTTTSPIVIFGGSTTSATGFFGECTSPTEGQTCNSCTGMTNLSGTPEFYRCAQRNVYKGLKIKISFTMDTVPANATVKVAMSSTAATSLQFVTNYPTTPPPANSPITVEIDWNEICKNGDSGTIVECDGTPTEAAFKKEIWVAVTADAAATATNGIKFQVKWHNRDAATSSLVPACPTDSDPMSDSFCYFKVSPGDSKVSLSELAKSSIGPDTDAGINWQALRVYHAVADCSLGDAGCNPNFASIPLGTDAVYEDLPLSDRTKADSDIKTSRVTSGFENEVEYMFNVATVDEAYVVSGFIDPTQLDKENHTATPGVVIGALDGKHCFIATAAFGSEMASQVEILRKFRNQFLLSNSWGRSFVQFYYKHSPAVAHYISQHEILRTFVRGSLWPFIAIAYLSTELGGVMATLILVLGISTLIWVIRPRETT